MVEKDINLPVVKNRFSLSPLTVSLMEHRWSAAPKFSTRIERPFSLLMRLAVCFIFIGCLITESAHKANGAQPIPAPAALMNGVRFRVDASIRFDPKSHYKDEEKPVDASLWVNIRISSHAIGSEFYGVISKNFSKLADGQNQQFYWQDQTCHQRRGYPKVTVTSIEGSINGDQKTDVHARARHIGLPLPIDEIIPGPRLPGGVDKNGSYTAFRSETKQSQLFIDVKTYIANCQFIPGKWHFNTLNPSE